MSAGIATVTIERLVGGGLGLAHHDGATWMVAGALPGERVTAQPARRRAGVVEAATLEVCSDHHGAREPAPCPHADRCGGCDWPHVDAARGAPLKAMAAAGAARQRADLASALAAAPVRTSPLAYRLRARLHWDPQTRTLGFYRRRSWQVTPIPSCRILSPRLVAALPTLAEQLGHRCPQAVDVEWLEDLDGGDAVAALRGARNGAEIETDWVPDESDLGGVVDGFHRLTRAGRIQPCWGATTVTMALPVPLEAPIGAFFQGNRHLLRWLFDHLGAVAGDEAHAVYDLHAGVGFMAAAVLAATGPREFHLVEPFRPAARAAARNLDQARVAVGRSAETYLSRRRRLERDALVLTDPPRAGMSLVLRHRLAGWHPRRIVMLACDPATWTRDTGFLLDHGYRLAHLELVDLFPSTHHVEVLAVLEEE